MLFKVALNTITITLTLNYNNNPRSPAYLYESQNLPKTEVPGENCRPAANH
jgi:hypothetical protein